MLKGSEIYFLCILQKRPGLRSEHVPYNDQVDDVSANMLINIY